MIKQGRVGKVVAVGGPTKKDGASKVKLMAERIEGEVIQLETVPSTGGNVANIKKFLAKVDSNKRVGVLTSFYHIPRVLRLMIDNGLVVTPISAEAVLLGDSSYEEKIGEWYGSSSMLDRFRAEIRGMSHIEYKKYKGKTPFSFSRQRDVFLIK